MSISTNPYEAPQASLLEPASADVDNVEALRHSLLSHEMQLKAVGSLYFLFGFLLLLSLVAVIPGLLQPGGNAAYGVGVAAFFASLSVLYLGLGYGFRTLRHWVRVPGALVSTVGLLAIPVGTLISAWILYLMFCAKGRRILSPDYRGIVEATPHIRYRRTVGDWIAVGLVVLLLAGGVITLVVIGTR